jgi:hypothetical protein
MDEQKERKAPFPQAGKKKDKKYQSYTDNKKRSPCHNPELKRCGNIPVSSYIKEVLFKIHSHPDIFCSGKVIRDNVQQFMQRNAD